MAAGTLRIGLIGCGGIAPAHLAAYQQNEGTQVVAVADVLPAAAAAMAAKAGAVAYSDCAQMLESDGDESAFERHIGNIEDIEKQWYAHVLGLKRELTGLRTPPVTLTQVNGQSEDPGQ